MVPDFALVAGVVLAAFSIPAFISAKIDMRKPVVPGVFSFCACGLVTFAHFTQPGGYAMGDVPGTVVRVIGAALH